MSRYAKDTEISSSKSRLDIEYTLARYGATSFAYATEGNKAMVAFKMHDRQARLMIPLPKYDDFKYTDNGRIRTDNSQRTAYEQATRQIWRVMLLMIKAKLEAIELEVTTFEKEFLADTLLPNGQTVADYMLPQIDQVYLSGKMPPLLPMLDRKD